MRNLTLVPLLAVFQFTGIAQQAPSVSRLMTGLTGDSVQISLIFDASATALSGSKMEFQKYAANTQLGETGTLNAKPDPLNATRLDFLVPMSGLTGADELAYSITLDDGRTKTPLGSKTWLTLAPLRTIESLNDQISKLKQQSQSLTNAIKAQQDVINDLNIQNASIRQRLRPTKVNPAESGLKRVTDQSAAFHFTTAIPGLVQVRVRKESDDSPVDQPQTTPTFATDHIFTFKKGLAHGEAYYVEAVVVDLASNTIVPATQIGKENPALHFQLANTTNQAIATLKAGSISDDTIQLHVDVDQKSALKAECYLVKNPATRERELVATKGSIANDSFGIPSGDYSQSQDFVFSGLLPEHPYEFEITGADQLGRGLAKVAVLAVSTVKKLDFDGPVQVTVTPSDFTVNWASTVPNPGSDLTGQFSVKFANAAPVVVLPVKPNGTNFSGSLDVVGLQKVFQAAKAASTTPTLIVSMDRAKEHLERSITVTFAVPKTADSAQQMAKKVVDSGSSAAGISQSLKAISDGVSQPTNKKFTWQDLLQAGLGILLKAI